MNPTIPPPSRPGHKIVAAGEPVVVVGVYRERNRDRYVAPNGIVWTVSK